MIYRNFCLRDLNQVEGISRESFPFPLSKLAILLLSVVCRIYVAVEEGNVLGYLVLGEKRAGGLFIFHIAVKSGCRKCGVASGFMGHFVDGVCSVRTHVSNAAAQRFYKKHGFKVLKRLRYSGDEDEYLMRREL